MKEPLAAWWCARSPREQRLLRWTAVAVALVMGLRILTLVARDFGTASARLATEERDLAVVRRLAAELIRTRRAAAAGDDTSLVTRMESAAATVVGRERIASMTPLVGPADGVAMRLVGASLGDTVRILHAVESADRQVAKLDLVKHPDDPGRFDVVLEITGGATP